MLGIIGFLIGALVIASFAITSQDAYATVEPRRLKLFGFAFGSLALTMLLWAGVVAMGSDNPINTREMLVAGDVILLAGTSALVAGMFRRTSILVMLCLAAVAALAVMVRSFQYPPAGFVLDGLLHFNLTGDIRLAFTGIFLLIWLPAMIQVAREAVQDRAFIGLEKALPASFMVLIFVTTLFLSARRPAVIIGLFVAIIVTFLAMTLVNLIAIHLHGTQLLTEPAAKSKPRKAAK